MPCPICFESEIESPTALTQCGHIFCKTCLEEWILRVERSSSDPTCPECRSAICDVDINAAIGRSIRHSAALPYYQTIGANGNAYGYASVNEDYHEDCYEPDEFTRVYLENLETEGSARRCPSCRAWIMLAEGCNNIMCRCGCKFCFCCGQRGSCMGATFFNNITGVEDRVVYEAGSHEEDAGALILPIMTDFWYAVEDYDGPIIDPLFEGDIWNFVVTEAEESRIAPLFEGLDWELYPGACCENADEGVARAAFMWEEIMNVRLDEDDAESVTDYYGSTLFT